MISVINFSYENISNEIIFVLEFPKFIIYYNNANSNFFHYYEIFLILGFLDSEKFQILISLFLFSDF